MKPPSARRCLYCRVLYQLTGDWQDIRFCSDACAAAYQAYTDSWDAGWE